MDEGDDPTLEGLFEDLWAAQAKAERLREALSSLVSKRDGRYFSAMQEDADVTHIVGNLLGE
jgi:hypothetical protein